MPKHSTGPVQLSLKLSPGQIPWRGRGNVFSLFRSYGKTRGKGKTMWVAAKQISSSRRFPTLDKFLRKHKSQIKVFAEVGAANGKGAPMAFDARNALGRSAKVFAVDVVKMPNLYLNQRRVTPVLHAISRKPLPFKCDAIRLTNVTMYMSESDVRRSIVNIWKSLNEGGFLLGSNINKLFILRKTSTGFEEVLGWKRGPTMIRPVLPDFLHV
ncbi:Uncharacterised protein [uncultured archaeon]|nr:Uncharacterised protein [uncultured archaeon]